MVKRFDDHRRVRVDGYRHWHRERSASSVSGGDSVYRAWHDGSHPHRFSRQYQYDATSIQSREQQVTKPVTGISSKPIAFIAFYISNFPSELSYVELRKGLEVCGILSDIHISRYLNVRGQSYGFARFANVRNVEKLSAALKNVIFGDFRLHANVAKFNMFDKTVKKEGDMEDEGKNRVVEGVKIKRRVDEGGERPKVLNRKEELEKVKVEAIKTEEEKEKIRDRERER